MKKRNKFWILAVCAATILAYLGISMCQSMETVSRIELDEKALSGIRAMASDSICWDFCPADVTLLKLIVMVRWIVQGPTLMDKMRQDNASHLTATKIIALPTSSEKLLSAVMVYGVLVLTSVGQQQLVQ